MTGPSQYPQQEPPSSTAFSKVKWASKEAREYIVIGSGFLVVLETTGTLDRLFPKEVAKPTASELAPAVESVDTAGRVVIDPKALDLEPFIPPDPDFFAQVDIGQALILECPFDDGCTVEEQTGEIPLPFPSSLPAGFPLLRGGLDDGVGEGISGPVFAEVSVPVEIEFVDSDPVADNSLVLALALVGVVVVVTTIYKRVWRRLWSRLR